MHLGVVHHLRQPRGFADQLLIQLIVVRLFAGEVNRNDSFAAFRPGLIFHHPHRARALAQQMPVGRGKNHRFQPVVLMRHLQHQIVPVRQHLLDNRFIGAIMPDHLDFDLHARLKIGARLLADPLGALADHALPHRGALVRGEQRGHLI